MFDIQASLLEQSTIGAIDEERHCIRHVPSEVNTNCDAEKAHEQRRYHCKDLPGILSSYAKLSIQRQAFRQE